MRRFQFVLVLFLILIVPLSAQVSKSYLQNMYMNYLKQQGYVPEVDKDGDIEFKYEGRTYYIIVDEDDPEFFEILYPYFWEMESSAELQKAKSVISSVNRTTKVAKIHLTRGEDNASISGEVFLKKPEDFKEIFSRLLRAMNLIRGKFREEMNK